MCIKIKIVLWFDMRINGIQQDSISKERNRISVTHLEKINCLHKLNMQICFVTVFFPHKKPLALQTMINSIIFIYVFFILSTLSISHYPRCVL